MVEFIIVTPIILLLLLGAFQFALIYHAKTVLNYAAFEAARFGAVSNARKTEMENAFTRAMAAIHTHDNTENNVICARETVRREMETGFVNIEIMNPTREAFDQLGIPEDGDVYIPNDNLKYRYAVTSSGLTIQDANLLKIRVSYCYPLYVPYINRVLGIMLTKDPSESCPGCTGALKDKNTFERRCLENGRFPINTQAVMRMQSPALLSAVSSGTGPGIPSVSREPFYQCDNSSFSVKETMTPQDITRQSDFWTLSNRTGP